jgi:AraC-like DNA-binding protein
MTDREREIQVHLDCFNYSKNKDNPLIEIRRYNSGTTHQIVASTNAIVVILNGTLNYSLGQTISKQAAAGTIVMLPIKHHCLIEMIEDTTLIILRLDIDINFCDHFSLEMLYREKRKKKEKKGGIKTLEANSIVISYLNCLAMLLNDGLYCGYLLELKLKEFLYILRYYYPLQELKDFFASILSDDFKFLMHVMKNYDPTLTVDDLVKKMHYSLSGFEKRFKKVFDMPPSQWLQAQKARAVYHEINCTTKTSSELGYEFGFSSPSHFNNFCKRVFNNSPGNIRKKNQANFHLSQNGNS